jgi:hypothetical protein
MEQLLRLLPSRPQPLLLRWGVTVVLVGIFGVFRLATGPAAGQYGFIFYIPPILVAAILFNRGTGILATLISAIFVGVWTDWATDDIHHIAALTLFVVVSLFVAVVGETMRIALERQVKAQTGDAAVASRAGSPNQE